MKKQVCVFLAALQLCLLTACSDVSEDETSENSSEVSPEESLETAEEEEEELQPDLPAADFNGKHFIFLTREWQGDDWVAANQMGIYAEEETGEGVNDSVFQRNLYIEDTYNTIIEEVICPLNSCSGKIRSSVAASDQAYDVAYIAVGTATELGSTGSFLNYKNVPYIDFNMPWWDIDVEKEMTIADRLYFAANSIMLTNYNATSAMIFNKDMMTDYGFTENIYDVVKDYGWSLEKLGSMSEAVYNDVDGNGVRDENDVFGFLCYRDAALSMFASSKGRIATKDSEGNIAITIMRANTYDALMASLTLMAQDATFNLHKELEATHPGEYYSITENMFRRNHGLFYWILVHDIQKFRDMESEFGVLPVPSYDPESTGYHSNVNQHHGCLMSILTTADPDMTGVVLEAMAAKSFYTVQKEYYDVCLTRKYTRDSESQEMLDIIFNNRVYDIGAYFSFGNLEAEIRNLTMMNSTDIASKAQSVKRSGEKQIERLIKAYEKLD